MHPNHLQSSSSPGSEPQTTTWRLSSSTPRPASEPADSSRQRSDLGSDEDWQFTMGSDSDLSDPIQQQPLSPITLADHSPNCNTSIQQSKDTICQQNSAQQLDELPQLSLIQGYKGVTNRAELSTKSNSPNQASIPPVPISPPAAQPPTIEVPVRKVNYSPNRQHPTNIADNCGDAPSPKETHCDNPVSQSTPLTLPHENPIVQSEHHQPSTSASNYSPKAASKSVTFGLANPTHSFIQEQQGPPNHKVRFVGSSGQSIPGTLYTPSGRSSASLRTAERKISGLRTVIRDGRSRLGGTRFGAGKIFQKRNTQNTTTAPRIPTTNHVGNASAHAGGFRDLAVAHEGAWSHASVNENSSQRPLSTHSEGMAFSRLGVALLDQEKRPISTPTRGVGPFEDGEKDGKVDAFFEEFAVKHVTDSMLPEVFHNGMTPTTKHLSFLECVCQALEGTDVFRRKRFMNASNAYLWVTPDMLALKYRTTKKGMSPEVHSLPLSKVRKLKGCDREITIEMNGEKKPFDFVFMSKERANIWLSGLCCLVPAHATVKSRNRRWQQRGPYDPLSDDWQGKPLILRKRLNEYIFLETIGRGSSAKVKLAFSSTERKFYAIKVLMKSALRQRCRERTTFVRMAKGKKVNALRELTVKDVNEIAVMMHLNHENVMKMVGVFDDTEEDRLYIVLEYLAGRGIMTSSDSFGSQRLGEDRVRSILVDVLCGLEYLHRNNVAHRDIKPENLLKTGDGTVKISDFGSAIKYKDDDLSSEEGNGSILGTPAFTAPELCVTENSPRCPQRCFAADIWSLGASLFYMVYGRIPFYAANVFQIYDVICTQEIVFPETPVVTKSLQSLIENMLVKDPCKRATISEIIDSPWLSDNVEVAERLGALRLTIQQHVLETPVKSGNIVESPSSEGVAGSVG